MDPPSPRRVRGQPAGPLGAVHALLEDGHAGRAYDMTGPAALSLREQVAAIAAAIGADVRLEQVSRS